MEEWEIQKKGFEWCLEKYREEHQQRKERITEFCIENEWIQLFIFYALK